jgi:hypothetical protein
MVFMMNQLVRRIQPKCLYLGNRITQDVDQALIAVGDAATLTVVDKDSIGIVLDYFFEMNRGNFSAEFTIPSNRDDVFQAVFFQGNFSPHVKEALNKSIRKNIADFFLLSILTMMKIIGR